MIPKKINIRITRNNNYGLFITSLVMCTISKKKILFVIIFNEFLKILKNFAIKYSHNYQRY